MRYSIQTPWLLVLPPWIMVVVTLFSIPAGLSADGNALVRCTAILVLTLVIGFGVVVTAIKERPR